MTRRKTQHGESPKSQEEAMRVAKATQRPGQTKEQTKLIAQGIQKGIEQYKKQQSAKARELDKRLKKVRHSPDEPAADREQAEMVIHYRQSKLAWVLLLASWAGFAFYLAISRQ